MSLKRLPYLVALRIHSENSVAIVKTKMSVNVESFFDNGTWKNVKR